MITTNTSLSVSKNKRFLILFFAALGLSPLLHASATADELDRGKTGFEKIVAPVLKEHCLRCHGPTKQAGKFRLDALKGNMTPAAGEVSHWQAILERLATGEMPPKKEPQPNRDATQRMIAWLEENLRQAGSTSTITQDLAFPVKGNTVDHDLLFGDATGRVPGGDPRIWRISPFGYHGIVGQLTHRSIGGKGPIKVPAPFGLANDHGFRDYAFRYKVGSSETEQMAMNAKKTVALMLKTPIEELRAISKAKGAPTEKQIRDAVTYMFIHTLSRTPAKEELERYSKFAQKSIAQFGNHDGLVRGLAVVLLHPEAIFRVELAEGPPDPHGRRMLAPLELARALAFALTDNPPDEKLLQAAQSGRLKSAGDVRREVTRLFNDKNVEKPRILRFFQEYFGYTEAALLFKDDYVIKAAKIGNYNPGYLVEDTDYLIQYILDKDRDVLREMLTTEKSFVYHAGVAKWLDVKDRREMLAKQKGKPPATHPFGKLGRVRFDLYYNFPPEKWSVNMPFDLPPGQRSGILTQPAWLVAFSTNTDNHAILRGKWVRERLLGGQIPDTPINVDAQLPDEPKQPLRHRMRVTREEYCWKCHQRMDPLGLPFQMYDGFGRFRTQELGKPVDASGAIVDSGDPKLDGPVNNALEMIRKLADSKRVEQVFVRHAFRYWMGRNETLDDAPTLQAAHAAYKREGGSMKALIAALLSSDSFLYRRAVVAASTR
jgi:mono/diheme cytochrome c family protein